MAFFWKVEPLLFIAHRLSAVKQADHVYVFEQGIICEQGRHETLINQNGLLRQTLWRIPVVKGEKSVCLSSWPLNLNNYDRTEAGRGLQPRHSRFESYRSLQTFRSGCKPRPASWKAKDKNHLLDLHLLPWSDNYDRTFTIYTVIQTPLRRIVTDRISTATHQAGVTSLAWQITTPLPDFLKRSCATATASS